MYINKETLVLADVVEKYTLSYGNYIIDEMFPNYIDGLKIVIRRILWSIYKYYPNYIPSMDIIGITSRIHEHSPNSIYDAMIRLSQPFTVLYPLFDIKGDNGSYSGDAPASDRYTKARISDFAYDIYFKDLNTSLLEYKFSDNLTTLEPKYLIPSIPVSLVLYSKSIGYGFHSSTLSYTLEMVKKLLDVYLDKIHNTSKMFDIEYQRDLYKTISKSYNIHTVVPLENIVLRHSLDKTRLEGKIDFIDNRTLVIYNLPYSVPFEKVHNKIINILKNNDYIVDSTEASSSKNSAEYIIKFKKNNDIYNNMLKILKTIYYVKDLQHILNYTKDGFIISLSTPFELIKSWYKRRQKYLVSHYNFLLSKYQKKILELESKLLIIKYPKLKDIIQSSENDEISRQNIKKYLLSKNEKITSYQADCILNTKIKVFNQQNKDSIQDEINKYKSKIWQTHNELSDTNNAIYYTVKDIVEKYSKKSYISKYPSYKGYIVLNNQMSICYSSYKELQKYVNMFKKDISRIQQLRPGKKVSYGVTPNNTLESLGSYPPKISKYIYFTNGNCKVYSLELLATKSKLSSKLIFPNIIDSLQKYIIETLYMDGNLYINKRKISNIEKDLHNKSVFIKPLYQKDYYNITDFIIVLWLDGEPNKVRCIYSKYVSENQTKLPIRYNEKLLVIDIIPIYDNQEPYPLYIGVNEKIKSNFNNLVYIIDVDKLKKYLSKNENFMDINLNRFVVNKL